jgi:hypothetical protein
MNAELAHLGMERRSLHAEPCRGALRAPDDAARFAQRGQDRLSLRV